MTRRAEQDCGDRASRGRGRAHAQEQRKGRIGVEQREKPGRAGGAAGTRRALGWMTGARYQIAVDGQPRSNRDDKAIAIEAAEYLKYKHPHAEVTMHDLVTGDTITIKALPPGRAP